MSAHHTTRGVCRAFGGALTVALSWGKANQRGLGQLLYRRGFWVSLQVAHLAGQFQGAIHVRTCHRRVTGGSPLNRRLQSAAQFIGQALL